MNIGQRIKTLRGKESREEFAPKVGIHPQTLYRYEAGDRSIDSSLIEAICKLTGVSPEWLIFGTGPMRPGGEEAAGGVPAARPEEKTPDHAAQIADLERRLREKDDTITVLTMALKSANIQGKLCMLTEVAQYPPADPPPAPSPPTPQQKK